MKNQHLYTLKLDWIGNPSVNSIKNDRLYEIAIPGKEAFKGSADGTFYGDPSLLNPEDLLLSALSSCHMMSYFYVCRKRKIAIESYQDEPIGNLELSVDGSGRFTSVTLKPTILLKNKTQKELAQSLHHEASKLCFIANSCNFAIKVEAIIS